MTKCKPDDVAECWAEENLHMVRAVKKNNPGFDGILPNGRRLQVKSKKADAWSDAGTCVDLSESTLDLADDLLIVFVDYETCSVTRTVGPVPICELAAIGRHITKLRCTVSGILDAFPDLEKRCA